MGTRPRIGVGGRFAVALVLTLGPTLALGYIGYRAVAEREQGLRVAYTSTGVLVRDRLSTELATLVASITRDVTPPPSADDIPALQAWLRTIASERPWLADPFVARLGGGLVTEHLWIDRPDTGRAAPSTESVSAAVRDAEMAEFRQENLPLALGHYRRALGLATTTEARAGALSRIGRTLFKLRLFDEGIESYRAILMLPPDTFDAHGLPYPVIALSQIRDGLEAVGRADERDRVGLDLQRYVVDHPWDARSGYGYYVTRAQQLNPQSEPELQHRLAALARDVTTIEWINRNVQPRIEAGLTGAWTDNSAHRLGVTRDDAPVVIGAQPWGAATPDSGRSALGFTIRTDYVAGPLLAKIVTGVELGGDVRVTVVPGGPAVGPAPLAAAPLGDQLPGWTVAIVDARGRTIEQLTARERWSYGGLVGGVLSVLVVGLIFTTRAWAREAELSRLQTDFVSNVSHELKTPLALIRMFGETLESGLVVDAGKRQEFYGIIRRESERLTHLINNVLDTAKIEAGTKQFSFERGDVVSLVREALDAYAPLFDRLHFDVTTTLPDAPLAVSMDRDAVAQALVNLFQNAIRYSGEAKQVTVAVSAHDAEVVVSVADRGVGIAEDDLPRIFDKFYRSRAVRVPETPGSGLGLSIVSHVMKAHGGRVEVESTEGRGSVFTLVFPLERSAA